MRPPTDEITTTEALMILDLEAPSTISRWVAAGRLRPSRRLPGERGTFLFWRADIERLAADRATERAARQAIRAERRRARQTRVA